MSRTLFRSIPVVLAVVGLAGVAGWVVAASRAPLFEAQALVLLRDPLPQEDARITSPTTATMLMLEPQVVKLAAEASGMRDAGDARTISRDHLRFRELLGTRFVEITARHSDPAIATRLANELPRAALGFQDMLWVGAAKQRQTELSRQVELSARRLNELRLEMQRVSAEPRVDRLDWLRAELRAEMAALSQRERDRDAFIRRGGGDQRTLGELQSGIASSRRRVDELERTLSVAGTADTGAWSQLDLEARWRAALQVHENLVQADEAERVKPRVPVLEVARPAREAERVSATPLQGAALGAIAAGLVSALLLVLKVLWSASLQPRTDPRSLV